MLCRQLTETSLVRNTEYIYIYIYKNGKGTTKLLKIKI